MLKIGDHQQLRPSTAHPYLSERCHLDVSLFERLVNNGVPYQTLKTQHRMRPDIACLLTPVFYSVLENHPCTLNREPVRGMRKNMYFFSHSVHEKEVCFSFYWDSKIFSHNSTQDGNIIVCSTRQLMVIPTCLKQLS